jgi:excisionase family DNA binding protein
VVESLSTTEAADILGMASPLLARLCKEGRVPSHAVGTLLHIAADDLIVIQRERVRLKAEAREHERLPSSAVLFEERWPPHRVNRC